MGWNPADWQITDTLQGQTGGYDLNPLDNGGMLTGGSTAGSLVNTLSGGTTAPITNTAPTNQTYWDGSNLGGGSTTGTGDQGVTIPLSVQDNGSVDPYAQWGGQANYGRLMGNFNTQKQGIFDSVSGLGDNLRTQFSGGIRDFIQGAQNSQDALNRRSVDNEAKKIVASQGILGALGRGIQSGNVMLANRNAGNSSAAGAIARAQGEAARRSQYGVNNEYAAGDREIGVDQGLLQQSIGNYGIKLKENMDLQVNSAVETARGQLTSLDAQMAQASLPERIAIEQEKNNIKNTLITKLQGLDQEFATQSAGINPATGEQNRSTAQSNLAQGQVPEGQFAYDTASMQGQNTQDNLGLPIYTNSRRRMA